MTWKLRLSTLGAGVAALALAGPAQADPASCQKQIVQQLLKFKKIYLKAHVKCLDGQNVNKLPGPCPDTAALLRIQIIGDKVQAKIAGACTMADLATLGFPGDCQFETIATGIEGQCAALPVTTPAEFADCLMCWKGAELSEYAAIVYASHAEEVCGGDLDEESPQCSDLPCAAPLPQERDLGDTGENDCQRSIGKAAVKYLVSREKILEKCGLGGGTQASCLADLRIQLSLDKALAKLDSGIRKRCGNRDPLPDPPFCCRTGMGNQCTAATTRDECEDILGGDVQEGKVCGVDNNCDPAPGNQTITWWGFCPEPNDCGSATALATLDDLIACVDTTASQIVDELICLQIRTGGWPCPPDHL
jgi:hypothetical protein